MSTEKVALPSGDFKKGDGEVKLQRTLGLFNGVAVIVGVVVGSGIFVSPKGVVEEAGSIGAALIIWSLGGIICLIGALCFAELGTLFPSQAGGIHTYIMEAFGDLAGFLYMWMSVVVIFPAGNAAIALACGQYLLEPLFPCGAPDHIIRIIGAIALIILTFINCVSVKLATHVQDIFTIMKTVTLVVLIITGFIVIFQGKTDNFQNAFENTENSPAKISLSFYWGLFAYSGWYTVNFLTEELKDPARDLPRSIWIAMPIITVIYVLVNIAYFAVLSLPQILKSEAVAFTFAEKMYGYLDWLIPIMVACSCFGSLNGFLLTVSRLFFEGARVGHLPDVLALVSSDKYTPLPAVIFEGAVSVAMLMANDISLLINCVLFVEALSFLVATLALFQFRRIYPDRERPVKVHILLPIIFLIICVFLVIMPMYASPMDIAFSLVFLAIGLPVYVVGVMWKNKPRPYRRLIACLTCIIQKTIMGVPPDDDITKEE